jgi:hypothetical protein
MKAEELIDSAKTLVTGDRGLLAMEESNPTCNKQFARLRPTCWRHSKRCIIEPDATRRRAAANTTSRWKRHGQDIGVTDRAD